MQPNNAYKCYKAGKRELFDQDFAKKLAEKKEKGNVIYVVVTVDGEFDHWDIEEYVRIIPKLAIDMFYIKISDDGRNRPKYQTIKEINGALHHFANFIALDEKTGYQEFHYCDMKIFFEYNPKN